MRYRFFYNKTYKANLNLIVDCDEKAFYNKVDKILGLKVEREDLSDGTEGLYDQFYDKEGVLQRFIWIRCMDWSVSSMAILVHEIGHYVANVFTDKGIPYGEENQETICYFTEWLVNETFNSLAKKK